MNDTRAILFCESLPVVNIASTFAVLSETAMWSALNYAVTAAGARRRAGMQAVTLPAITFEQNKQLGRFLRE
jgi:hypothetical protein